MKRRSIVLLGAACLTILLGLLSWRTTIIYSRCQFPRIYILLLAALAGFYFAMALSHVPIISTGFSFVGKYSLSILIFHYISYDVVDAMRVLLYDLPWEHVSSFPIIRADWRWGTCYVIAGVGVPIMLNLFWQRIKP